MLKFIYRTFYNLLIIVAFLSTAKGDVYSLPRDLKETVDKSSLVVVGRLTSYKSTYKSPKVTDKYASVLGDKSNRDSGRYSFDVLNRIKGVCDSSLTLNLPKITSREYMDSKVSANYGSLFLVCLSKDSKGSFFPTDNAAPLVPLRDSEYVVRLLRSPVNGVDYAVVGLLISSLPSSDIRPIISYFLASFDDPRVPGAVVPYLNDPNPQIQDSVLACMAKNQQVAAIPLIIRLSNELPFASNKSVFELENYRTKRAVPALNNAVYNSSLNVRIAAVRALRKIQDVSSIPYFILALSDPDSIVAYHAYGGLHTFIPSLGPVKIAADFETNRKAETNLLLAWWKDELSGKHPKPKKPGTRAVAVSYSSSSSSSRSSNLFSSLSAK